MKKHRQYIVLLLIILLLTGCKSEKEKQKEAKIQKKDKAPSSLSDFSQGLQEILNYVEEIERVLDDSDIKMNESKLNKENKKDKTTPKNNNNEEDKKEEEEDKSKGKEETKKEEEINKKNDKLLELWINIDKDIEDIHNKWNLYGIEGNKKGITLNTKTILEENLNSLTKSIGDRNIKDIYEYGSQTMSKLGPVFNLYKDEFMGNTNKIRYYTYQSYLNAIEGKSKEGIKLLDGLGEDLNQIRNKLDKDEKKIEILDKLNLSIESMKIALKEDSIKLYRIKKDIIIENINELEK